MIKFRAGRGGFYISAESGLVFFKTSGNVSQVQLVIANGVTFTTITFTDAGDAQTFHFCGDVVGQFPINRFVTATYSRGGGCDMVQSVS